MIERPVLNHEIFLSGAAACLLLRSLTACSARDFRSMDGPRSGDDPGAGRLLPGDLPFEGEFTHSQRLPQRHPGLRFMPPANLAPPWPYRPFNGNSQPDDQPEAAGEQCQDQMTQIPGWGPHEHPLAPARCTVRGEFSAFRFFAMQCSCSSTCAVVSHGAMDKQSRPGIASAAC